MAIAHFPVGLAAWVSVACGVVIIIAHMRGIDEPRAWIEWIERRFAYSMRMRFIGTGQTLLGAGGIWLARLETGKIGVIVQIGLALVTLSGLAMLVAQNLSRHLVIGVAEQNDLFIRIATIVMTLLGLALVVSPFIF